MRWGKALPNSQMIFLDEDPLRWILLPQVDSTNSYLLEANFPCGTVCLARSQTAGRGRRGRKWLSIPGSSFIFSALLISEYSSLFAEQVRYLPLLVGMSLLVAVRTHWQAGRQSRADRRKPSSFSQATAEPLLALKWPNDLYLTRWQKGQMVTGKLAGILVESEIKGRELRIVLGAGLNWSGKSSQLVEGQLAGRQLTENGGQSAKRDAILPAVLYPAFQQQSNEEKRRHNQRQDGRDSQQQDSGDNRQQDGREEISGSGEKSNGTEGGGDPFELAPFFVKAINARLPLLYADVTPLLDEIRNYFYLRDRIIRLKNRLYRVRDLTPGGGLSLENLSNGKIGEFYQNDEQIEIISH